MRNQEFQFGPFKLDLPNHIFLREDAPVSLPPKAFDVLAYLVQKSGHLVTRDEIMKVVWPDSFVEDANITVNISLLRKALGEMDDGRPYIQTVPRKGYRFNMPVIVVEARAPGNVKPLILESSDPKLPNPCDSGRMREGKAATQFGDAASERLSPQGEIAHGPALPEVIPFPEPRQQDSASLTGGGPSLHPSSRPEIGKPPWQIPLTPMPALRRRRRWVLAVTLCVGIAAFAAGWFHWRHSLTRPPLRRTRLTSFAPEMAVTAAAISTGSKFIAYANPSGLFIQVISSGEMHALRLPAPHFQVSGISWFPDSAELLVGGAGPGDVTPSLWIVPVIGASAPTELGPYPPGVVSPDGSEIAWVRRQAAVPEIQLMRSSGGAIQTLVKGASGEVFGSVSWSLDGRSLLFARYSWDPQLRHNSGSIDSYGIGNGRIVKVLSGSDLAGDVVSLRDGRVLYSKTLGENPSASGSQLLEVQTDPRTGVAAGPPVVVATWETPITGFSVNSSGTRLVLRDSVVQHNIYLADLEDSGKKLDHVRRFTLGAGREDFPHAWSPDGKVVFFDSDRSGHWEIFRRALKGDSDDPFVQGPDDQFSLRVSPDGNWLLYIDRPTNWREPQAASVMRVPISGGLPQQVLKASRFSEWGLRFECPERAGMPCVLAQRQGSQIVFRVFDPKNGFKYGSTALARVGNIVTDHFAWCVALDGSSIAWIESSPTDNRVHLLPIEQSANGFFTSSSERDITIAGATYLHSIAWSPDAKGWFIVRQFPASWELLYVGPAGRASELLTVPNGFAPDVIPSPKGGHLAFSEQSFSSNVWLLRNF